MASEKLAIRPEYSRVADVLSMMLKDFGVELSEKDLVALRTLLYTTELIDKTYDSLNDPRAREKFVNNVLAELSSDERFAGKEEELGTRIMGGLCILKQVLKERNCRDEFVNKIRELFGITDQIRDATQVQEAADLSLKEGEVWADIMFTVIGDVRKEVREFIRKTAGLANLLDDFVDAKQDFTSGERLVFPNFDYYKQVGLMLAPELFSQAIKYPNKFRIVWFMLKVLVAVPKYRRKESE